MEIGYNVYVISSDYIQDESSDSTKWGGKRHGAGRKVGSVDSGERLTQAVMLERIQRMQASGAIGHTARAVLNAMGGDVWWLELIQRLEMEGNTDKLVGVAMFLLQMRDGRPAQQINVTSATVHFSAEQIARARATVRQLTAANAAPLTVVNATESQPLLSSHATCASEDSPSIRGEEKAKHNAFEGEGQKKDG